MKKSVRKLFFLAFIFCANDVFSMSSVSTEKMLCGFTYVLEAKVIDTENIKCLSKDLQGKCVWLSNDFRAKIQTKRIIAKKELSELPAGLIIPTIGINRSYHGTITGLGLPKPIQEKRYRRSHILDIDEEIKIMNMDIEDYVAGKSFIFMLNFIDDNLPKFLGLAWQLDSEKDVLDTLRNSSQKSCARAV